jgi:hypothetical protein
MVEKFQDGKHQAPDSLWLRAREQWRLESQQSIPTPRLQNTSGAHLPQFSLTGMPDTHQTDHHAKRKLKVESGDGPFQMLQREHPFRTPQELAKEAHKIKQAMGHRNLKAGDELTPHEDGTITTRRTRSASSGDFTETHMAGGKAADIKTRTNHGGGFTEVTDHKLTGRKTVHERNPDGSFKEEERDKKGVLKRTLTHEVPHPSAKPETASPSAAHPIDLKGSQPNYDKIAKSTVAREDDPKRRTFKEKVQDGLEDGMVRWTGRVPGNLTIGPAEMKTDTIKRLVKEHPDELGHMQNGNPLVAALDRNNANLLAKAYFKEKADQLNCGLPGVPEGDLKPEVRKQVNERVRELWKSSSAKDREEALIRLYNPGAGASYVNEVRKHEEKK